MEACEAAPRRTEGTGDAFSLTVILGELLAAESDSCVLVHDSLTVIEDDLSPNQE
jgi:hypothetical protein